MTFNTEYQRDVEFDIQIAAHTHPLTGRKKDNRVTENANMWSNCIHLKLPSNAQIQLTEIVIAMGSPQGLPFIENPIPVSSISRKEGQSWNLF